MQKSAQDLKFNGEELFLTLADGATVRVIKTGQGTPLLLMHTIRTQIEYFSEMIPFYAANHTVYALDLPGHGQSSIHKNINYDEPYLRAAITQVIQQLRLSNLTLVGESIGATLALTLAATLPNHIKQVFAVNPYDYETRYADGIRRGNLIANFMLWNYAITVHGAIFAAFENQFFLSLVMNGGVTNVRSIPEWLMKLFAQTGRRAGYKYLGRNILKNWRSWSQATNLYPQVSCPVTLVYGEFDWSRQQERTATLHQLVTARIETITGAGHFLSVDNPAVLQRIFTTAYES